MACSDILGMIFVVLNLCVWMYLQAGKNADASFGGRGIHS